MDNEWYNGLSEKQRRFCEAFSANGGNAFDAAKQAGYKQPQVQGHENMKKPRIIEALERLRQPITKKAIATREDRQAWWSEVMKNEDCDITARLRASELLGRSQADFTDKHDVNQTGNITFEMVYKEPEKP